MWVPARRGARVLAFTALSAEPGAEVAVRLPLLVDMGVGEMALHTPRIRERGAWGEPAGNAERAQNRELSRVVGVRAS